MKGSAMNIEIRQIDEADLDEIKSLIRPSFGRSHAVELQDQDRELISILVAWVDGVPSGYSFVSWTGARDAQVRALLPGVPEFYRLTVLESVQSKGIGTALIRYIEQMAVDRGLSTMGLGVAYENPRAHALYQRLGYVEAVAEYYDRYRYRAGDGQVHEVADRCRFMIRSLDG